MIAIIVLVPLYAFGTGVVLLCLFEFIDVLSPYAHTAFLAWVGCGAILSLAKAFQGGPFFWQKQDFLTESLVQGISNAPLVAEGEGFEESDRAWPECNWKRVGVEAELALMEHDNHLNELRLNLGFLPRELFRTPHGSQFKALVIQDCLDLLARGSRYGNSRSEKHDRLHRILTESKGHAEIPQEHLFREDCLQPMDAAPLGGFRIVEAYLKEQKEHGVGLSLRVQDVLTDVAWLSVFWGTENTDKATIASELIETRIRQIREDLLCREMSSPDVVQALETLELTKPVSPRDIEEARQKLEEQWNPARLVGMSPALIEFAMLQTKRIEAASDLLLAHTRKMQ